MAVIAAASGGAARVRGAGAGRDVHGGDHDDTRRIARPATLALHAAPADQHGPGGQHDRRPRRIADTYYAHQGELLIEQNLTIAGAGARTTDDRTERRRRDCPRVRHPAERRALVPTVTISGLDDRFGKRHLGTTNGSVGGNMLNAGNAHPQRGSDRDWPRRRRRGRRDRQRRRHADGHALADRGQPRASPRQRRGRERDRELRHRYHGRASDDRQLDDRQQHRGNAGGGACGAAAPRHEHRTDDHQLDDRRQRRRTPARTRAVCLPAEHHVSVENSIVARNTVPAGARLQLLGRAARSPRSATTSRPAPTAASSRPATSRTPTRSS